MKLKIFFVLILSPVVLLHSISRLDLSDPAGTVNKEFFLSFPNSGTNLTVGLLQALTKKPVRSTLGDPNKVSRHVNRLNLELDNSKLTLYRLHGKRKGQLAFLRSIDHNKNKLLLILRNPKECIVRHFEYSEKDFMNSVISESGGYKFFIENLKLFDSWGNQKTKLVIYYENLITNPRREMIKVLDFFEESHSNLDNIFTNLEGITGKILESYQTSRCVKKRARMFSGGNQSIYHSRNFSKENMQIVDEYISSTYPNLWNKYLKRYQTE